VSLDVKSGESKGFAHILFEDAGSAVKAYQELDGTIFQGRLIHILPGAPKRDGKLDEFAISKLPLKKQKQIRRKATAATSTFSWNSMYMNPDAIISSLAEKLGLAKSEILDPTSSDAAIKQAHAETHIIQETKGYFASQGVNLDAFQSKSRSDKVLLIKNFPYGTTLEELRNMLEVFGVLHRLIMPPGGTIAIAEFEILTQARAAFHSLAYRRFKDSVLFLEKGPADLFTGIPASIPSTSSGSNPQTSAADLLEAGPSISESVDTATLFVKNLSFNTTNDKFTELFRPLAGFLSATIKTKPDPKRPGETLSMGFGFLEFQTKSQADIALNAMNGYKLDGHNLVIKPSHKGMDAAAERRTEDNAKKVSAARTKLIIKNLPFEANKKDVRALFGAYGQLRSVRVPKKFDSTARGFAFADFVSSREAQNAIDALKDTHFLGRKLVLDFATQDATDAEREIELMQEKVGKQVNKVALQKLVSGGGRKKFSIADNEQEENGD
jgi:multiple RNA-binding domain-containing protein 1